ncbi:MAG: class I SAM-dependent methyltransferase [SAR324 cluster bacterium]|nr:class I SAM-dependent methyltransferase [SAR324 cluster bacterium]
MKKNHSPHVSHEAGACPLCQTLNSAKFCQDTRRCFLRCPTCQLVYVTPHQFLSSEREKARYDQHCNDPEDEGYRRFLNRLFLPLNQRIAPQSHGLDFGSGPGPTLHLMFEATGHSMEIYDCFYAREASLLEKKYDFITATEVLEHLHQPQQEITRLWHCLKSGGWFGIMTKLVDNRERFLKWHYKNDLTHVCFFSKKTFQWLAALWQAELTFIGDDVILMHKP